MVSQRCSTAERLFARHWAEMHYILFYDYVEDILVRREPHRPAHLDRLRDLAAAGAVRMAGALGDPVRGAAIIFRCEERATVEAFAREDPYVLHGLVTEWRVEPWNVVVGG